VSVGAECDFTDSHNVDVTISRPGYTASANTGETSGVCFEDIQPSYYTVTASKDGCSSLSKTANVACGDDASVFVGAINCSEGAFFEFSVGGCNGSPLPGATVTLSGANSGSATTDGDGNASIPLSSTGVTLWSVSHSSGRFKPKSGSVDILGLCDPWGQGVNLSPADGYGCCFPGLGGFPDNPYPISTSLTWTDCTGEYAFEIDPVGCGQDQCLEVPMDDVSLAGTTSCLTCTGGGIKTFPPTDIGNHPINTLLTLKLTSGFGVVRYFYRTYTNAGVKRLDFKSGAVCPDCGTNDSSRSWRMNATCEDLFGNISVGGINWETRGSTSYVVNSVVPFNMTATINPAGNGYGPGPAFTSWSGSAPCETVVISEAV